MSTHREERIQATVRHMASTIQGHEHHELGRFSCVYHARELVHQETQTQSRSMVEGIREAALASFSTFICDPQHSYEPADVQQIFSELQADVSAWLAGDMPLSHLMNSMNRTLSTGALQAHVTLCERFVSVHNIFSLLQLKQIQMQATQSLARSMNHTSQR